MTVTDAPAADLVETRAGRNRDTYRAYLTYLATATSGCCLCSIDHSPENEIIEQHSTMLVIRNRFPYAVWDSQTVAEHLMIVPVRHVLSFADFTPAESTDHFAAARRYEADGYSVYTRSQANKGRSVGHLHTHLISTSHWT